MYSIEPRIVVIALNTAITLLGVVAVFRAYRSSEKTVFLNYNFYLLVFGVFYLSLPAIILNTTGRSIFGTSRETWLVTGYLSAYFNFIFLVFFACSRKDRGIKEVGYSIHGLSGLAIPILAIGNLLLFLLIYYYWPQLMGAWGNRGLQSSLSSSIWTTYKIYPLFLFSTMLLTYVILHTRKLKYLIFLSPFLVWDVLTMSRSHILLIFLLVIVLISLLNYKVHILRVGLILFVIASIAVIRTGNFNPRHVVASITGEFTNTYATANLMQEANQSCKVGPALKLMIMRTFITKSMYDDIFGDYVPFMTYAGELNPLKAVTGLGGSMLGEAISFKNKLVLLLFPIVIACYGVLMNVFVAKGGYAGKMLFILAILEIFDVFRGSFVITAMYPFQLILYLGSIFVFSDLLIARFKAGRSLSRNNTLAEAETGM